MEILRVLENQIADKQCLDDLIDAFESMCQLPIDNIDDEENMILFETGTFSFTGEPLFNFSLVRQFPNDEEEYYQLHLDILYDSTETNQAFERADWDFDITENFFDYIRKSDEYIALKDKHIKKIDVYMDET